MTRGWLAAVVVFLLCLLAGSRVHAHESRPAYLELTQQGAQQWAMTWKVPGRDPSKRLALDVRLSEDCELLAPPVRSYAGQAFIEHAEFRRVGPQRDVTGLEGVTITIEGLSTTLTDVLVRIEDLDGRVQLTRLRPEAPSMTVAGAPTRGEVAKTYLGLGVEHILEGVDHLLFVGCLLLITGAGRKLVTTITGFTVAHSITLALATLDVVRVPVPPVEAIIALSIVFVAWEIVVGDETSLTHRYPVAVSSSFGLLHGFGFAAVLRDVGLPASEVPTSLLFFNVGVELGQLLFVGLLLVVGAGIKQVWSPTQARLVWVRRGAAYACGTLAAYWVIDRVAGFWS